MGTNSPFTVDVSKMEGYEKGEPVRLVWTGDWHIEMRASVYGAIRQMMDLETGKPNTYFLHGGDWFNAVTLDHPHANKAMGGNVYEFSRKEFLESEWIERATDRILKFAKYRSPKWIVGHSGNHDRRFEVDGHATIRNICKALGAAYGGIETPWTLRAEGKKIEVWSGHCYGGGGGEYVGTLQNRMERAVGRSDADLMLWAHFHSGTTVEAPTTGRSGDDIGITRRKVGAITPSMCNPYRRGQINHWAARFGPYRGIGYALIKWVPKTGFLKAEIVHLDDSLKDPKDTNEVD